VLVGVFGISVGEMVEVGITDVGKIEGTIVGTESEETIDGMELNPRVGVGEREGKNDGGKEAGGGVNRTLQTTQEVVDDC
jgi:predicted lysophospholipase L1 biosynthesis ABC-type transport system permease subunit